MTPDPANLNPLQFLKPHQLTWVLDKSRFKIWLAARQVGKSFATAFEVVLDAIETGQDWVILSRGERQARDFMRKVGQIADAIDSTFVAASYEEEIEDTQVLMIKLKNGAQIVGLPANPDTARGFSGNVVLDEFAFHEDPSAIWRAVFPIITNPLTGEKKLRIMSTPAGKNNKFYDLWEGSDQSALAWSKHKTDIYDAQAAGLFTAQQVEELKQALDDPDGWAQEYEVQFLEEATQYFTADLIDRCVGSEATTAGIVTSKRKEPRFSGLDIGRLKDLSVLFTLFKREERLISEEMLIMDRMPFEQQQAHVGDRLPFIRRLAVDASGMGEETGERLQTRFGEAKVEACKFTNEFKGKIFPGLKSKMQKGQLILPAEMRIKEDLLSIERQVTQGGTIRYVAARTEDGHADIANALALAVYAGTEPIGAWTAQNVSAAVIPPVSPFRAPRLRF